MSDNFGSTLAAANCDATFYGNDVGYKNYECARVVSERETAAHPHWAGFDESVRDFYMRQAATTYVKNHPGRIPIVLAARWARIVGVYAPFQEISDNRFLLDQPTWLGDLLLFSYYVVIVLAIAGVVVMRKRRLPIWPLLAIPVIVLISVSVTFAQVRYRAPAEVAFVLAAAVALDAAFSRVRRNREQTAAPPEPETVGVS